MNDILQAIGTVAVVLMGLAVIFATIVSFVNDTRLSRLTKRVQQLEGAKEKHNV